MSLDIFDNVVQLHTVGTSVDGQDRYSSDACVLDDGANLESCLIDMCLFQTHMKDSESSVSLRETLNDVGVSLHAAPDQQESALIS